MPFYANRMKTNLQYNQLEKLFNKVDSELLRNTKKYKWSNSNVQFFLRANDGSNMIAQVNANYNGISLSTYKKFQFRKKI